MAIEVKNFEADIFQRNLYIFEKLNLTKYLFYCIHAHDCLQLVDSESRLNCIVNRALLSQLSKRYRRLRNEINEINRWRRFNPFLRRLLLVVSWKRGTLTPTRVATN